jgi:hypothetical protein
VKRDQCKQGFPVKNLQKYHAVNLIFVLDFSRVGKVASVCKLIYTTSNMSGIEVVDAPELVQRITDQVDPERYNPEDLQFIPALGFVALQEAGYTYALGFCSTEAGEDGDPPQELHSITTLGETPIDERNIDRQGKGVGLRFHNTLASIRGMSKIESVALYGMQVDPDVGIMDLRKGLDTTPVGATLRIAKHAGRIIHAKASGLEKVVDGIHESYGEASLVLINQPPNSRRRQVMRGTKTVPGVDPVQFIVRDSSLVLRRAGKLRPELHR